MELYGAKLHVLQTLTGGLILHRNDKWPNIIKISVFFLLFVLFFVIEYFDLSSFSSFISCSIIGFIVLGVDIIVMWFNALLDESIQLEDHDNIDFESPIPPGIGVPLWENRKLLFNDRYSMDDRAFLLVRQGFDVEEVFRLVTLVHSGTVTKDTIDVAPDRRVRANLVILFGEPVSINLDRESLSRTFSRPPNHWHVLSSVILAFLLGICVGSTRTLFKGYEIPYVAAISAMAVFSMLLPPSCEPYSTTFSDPYISYTRITHSIFFFCIIRICQYSMTMLHGEFCIEDLGVCFKWSSLLNSTIRIVYYAFLLYPVFILFGVYGHPITTLHWILETVNKYLYGISGSSSFSNTVSGFMWSSLLMIFISTFMSIGSNPITIGVSILVVTFCSHLTSSDSCQSFMKSHLFTAIGTSTLAGSTSLLNWIIAPQSLEFILYCIIIFHFVFDVSLPYLTTHEHYFLFHGRALNLPHFASYSKYITSFITAPAFIAISLYNHSLPEPLGTLLIIQSLRLVQTIPHLFAYSLIMAMHVMRDDFGISSLSFSMICSLIVCRKLVKVFRFLRIWYKFRIVPEGLYKDPFSNTFDFSKSLILAEVVSTLPHILGGVSGPAFFWSLFSGSPMAIMLGYTGIYGFSSPRPNSFYDFIDTPITNEEFVRNSFEYPLEAPVYISLTEILIKKMGYLIKTGSFGLVIDDSFYLFLSDDLMAIVHIISIDTNKVSFQVRGLEYVSQTLCHGGELAVLQQISQEHQTFGNIGHAMIFRHSVFELRIQNLPLEMSAFSRINFLESIAPNLGRAFLMWELRSLVYYALKEFKKNELHDNLTVSNAIEEPRPETQPKKPYFSERNMEYIHFVASNFEIEITEQILKRLWIVTHFVHTIIVNPQGGVQTDHMIDLFEGKLEMNIEFAHDEMTIIKSFRFSLAILFLVSVGMEPDPRDLRKVFSFMKETDDTYNAFPLRSPEIIESLNCTNKAVITLASNLENQVELIRFSKTTTNWSVFQIESESIRGFWANEARSILFFALSSRERHSIQLNIESLRNISNQSCNTPVGYPAYVSSIVDSIYHNNLLL